MQTLPFTVLGLLGVFYTPKCLVRLWSYFLGPIKKLSTNTYLFLQVLTWLLPVDSPSRGEHADTDFIRYAPLLSFLVAVLGPILGP
jgi:hypothetical protein